MQQEEKWLAMLPPADRGAFLRALNVLSATEREEPS
jgi:hypothetical protein